MKNHWQVSKFLPLQKIFSPKQLNFLSYYYHKINSKIIERYEVNNPTKLYKFHLLKGEENQARLKEVIGLESDLLDTSVLKDSFGNYFKDVDGNDVLDMTMNNGFNVFGYNPRSIITKTRLQAFEQYVVNSFNTTSSLEYAADLRELNKLAPTDVEQVHLSPNDESAIEEAVRLACLSYITSNNSNTESFKIITLEGGNYQSANTISAEFPEINYPYIENQVSNLEEEERCINNLIETIKENKSNGFIIPAMVIEPIQYKAGVRYASQSYYRKIQKICQEENIKLIIDETYTCGWVTGRPFAFYDWCSNLVPDIVVFGGRMQLSGFFHKRNIIDLEELEAKNYRFNFRSQPDSAKLNYLLYLNQEVYKRDWLDLHASDFIGSIVSELKEVSKVTPFKITNVRGKGKLFAFDVDHKLVRDELIYLARKSGIKVQGMGENSIVFSPCLYFTEIHFTYFKKFLKSAKPTSLYLSKI